jgi:predicted dehydrogenase
MPSNNPIRVAIVRCDSHAYWFAPYLDEVDPVVFATHSEDAPTRQEVHQLGCVRGNYAQMAIQQVPGFVITKVFDRVGDRHATNTDPELLQYGSYPGRAIALSETLVSRPQVCETLEEAARDVDAAFICDSSSPHDGADHLEQARPFLEKGIPCFVDKPFAATYADAKAMVDLAVANDTVLMNASILSHTIEGAAFRRRFDEIGEAGLLTVKGVGFSNAGVGHGLALALSLFDFGVESVECMGSGPQPDPKDWTPGDSRSHLEYLLLHYPDERQVVVMNTEHKWFTANSEFFCAAYSKQGAIHSPGIGILQFPPASRKIVETFLRMVQTGTPPFPYEQPLELIAIIEAGRIAQKEHRRVGLSEVYDAVGGGP